VSDPGEDGDAPEIAEEIMAGFRRTTRGVSARFTSGQAGIIRNLVAQVAELVGGPGAAAPPPEGSPAAPGQSADEVLPVDLAAILATDGPAAPPEDPVLARLLPDAYGDDPDAAGEFRRYTEQGLRSGKVAAAQTVLATLPSDGGRVRLSAGDAEAWLRSINDVRLALGVVLGITEDNEHEFSELDPEDAREAYLHVYDWLTFLQETLVHALR
jgi:Domain of unknown function (DUF2017)